MNTASNATLDAITSQASAMDKLYGPQKRLFDVSRKYYLLGRDQLMERMAIAPGARVCEIGAGTARNLILLARHQPQGEYFGVDISAEMLDQARVNLARAGLQRRIRLERCAGEDLDHRAFGLAEPFDAVMFSYCLSMLPEACVRPAVAAAWRNLRPGGVLYYVDFGHMRGWPGPARRWFARWLGLFGAHFRQDIIEALEALTPDKPLDITALYGGYALLAAIHKPSE